MNPPSISVMARIPLWRTGGDTWHLTQQLHKYWHTIEALGGYQSAQFTIRGGRHQIDDWIQDGLGRHIAVYDDTTTMIWEGFVNKVTANYGPLAATRGPLMDVVNKVAVVYSSLTYDEDDNPVVGCKVTSTYYENAVSQGLWGILPRVLSTSQMEAADTTTLRYTYLINHMKPRTGKEWRSDNRTDTSVVVDCLGYVHWLNWAYNTTSGGTEEASTKIANILADTPNAAWLDFDTTHVDENTLDVPAWENEDNMAWSAVKHVTAMGDASYNRWLFGIYANREAWYQAAPTTVEYQQRLSQPRPVIEPANCDEVGEIYPWKVLPGKWLMFPDFLIGQAAELDITDDPRAMFIERVKYTAPNTLEMSGGTVDSVNAVLAQLGLSGIGS